MDFKRNNKSNNTVLPPNSTDTQSYYTESNAGHISVQTISPFRMRDSELASEQNLKGKIDRSYIFGKKLPKTACSSTTSKLLINQIIRETNIDGDSFMKDAHKEKNLHGVRRIEKKSNYYQHFLINDVEIKRSAPTFNSKYSSMQPGLCSRQETIKPVRYAYSNSFYQSECVEKSSRPKQYAEKTTLCRPVSSFNNELVKKMKEKNIRLQRLVKRLVLAREREKEIEAVNNYIIELKTKHCVDNFDQPNYSQKSQDNGQVDYFINNNYTQSMINGSNPCNDLLEEFYAASGINQFYPYLNQSTQYCQQSYLKNTSECYPMSSQGRLMMLHKGSKINPFTEDCQYPPTRRKQLHGNTIVVDKALSSYNEFFHKAPLRASHKKVRAENYKVNRGTYCIENIYEEQYKDISTQTNIIRLWTVQDHYVERGENFKKDILQEQYDSVSENVERLKKKIQGNVKSSEKNVLNSIENKLDILITTLNSFMEGVKSRTSVRKCHDCYSANLNRPQLKNHKMNTSRSDTYGLIKGEKLVCGLLEESTANFMAHSIRKQNISENSCETNIDKILIEEIDNSNKAKNEIENLLNGNTLKSCPVEISLHIPTKERSTAVTDSLSKSMLAFQDKFVSAKEIPNDATEEKDRMAVAVNTDPLSLLALLRVSTETVKQLLSYMPNFPYYSYLQMISLPQTRQDSHFVCNICGAVFEKPSQLSDHIRGHSLWKTRDCCVCRHVLDIPKRWPAGNFRCKYCGHRFTRAYCCELHQESCAKRFGLKHDVTPSLMLLR